MNRFLKTCIIDDIVAVAVARRAADSAGARRGSAVVALVVATAEPSGAVLTGDVADLQAVANHAEHVTVVPI